MRWIVGLILLLSAVGCTAQDTPPVSETATPEPDEEASTAVYGALIGRDSGEPLPGATIGVCRITTGSACRLLPAPTSVTDERGRFRLIVPPGNYAVFYALPDELTSQPQEWDAEVDFASTQTLLEGTGELIYSRPGSGTELNLDGISFVQTEGERLVLRPGGGQAASIVNGAITLGRWGITFEITDGHMQALEVDPGHLIPFDLLASGL